MINYFKNIDIKVTEKSYLKDPNSSDIGKSIISKAIEMIDEEGFETFTFKKLGNKIGSPESTIYRYFENKHKLLVYLTTWYWHWLEYRITLETVNIKSPEERLNKVIKTITKKITKDDHFSYINEVTLHNIIINESIKAYYNKDVNKENKEGYFVTYKRIVAIISDIVLEINPNYKYPHSLISTMFEGVHHQQYFSENLPALSDVNDDEELFLFAKDMVFNTIKI